MEMNPSILAQYNESKFIDEFEITSEIIGSFKAYAIKEGFKAKFMEKEAYDQGIKLLLKANLARQLYVKESFYKVLNTESKIIEEALQQLND